MPLARPRPTGRLRGAVPRGAPPRQPESRARGPIPFRPEDTLGLLRPHRLLTVVCLALLLVPGPTAAHNVGSGLAGHRLEVSLAPGEILVDYTLEIPASVWVRGFREAFPTAELLSDTKAWSAFRKRNLFWMEHGILCLWNGKETTLQRLRGEEQEAGLSADGFVRYVLRLRGEPPRQHGEATLILVNRNQAAIRGVFFVSLTVSPALRLTDTNLRDPAQRFLLDSRTGEPWSLWEGMRSVEVRLRPAPPWSSLVGGKEPVRVDNSSVYQELEGRRSARPGPGETGGESDSRADRLEKLLRSDRLDPGILSGALLLAFLLGGLHALAPGHGKALVGAYLVGTRGRPRDAMALGLIVTLTHVASVLLLGILSLAASKTLVPERLLPYLEVVSALLLVVLGIWMTLSRWPGRQHRPHLHGPGRHTHEEHLRHDHGVCRLDAAGRRPEAHDSHAEHLHHDHGHHPAEAFQHAEGRFPREVRRVGPPDNHPSPHTPERTAGRGEGHPPDEESHPHGLGPGPVDPYRQPETDRGQTHAGAADHPHHEETHTHHRMNGPSVERARNAERPQGGPPGPLSRPHRHETQGPPRAPASAGVRFREMLSLGISGGMVPCPSALAILLIAIAVQRIAFGIAIIVAFSLGLAAVLTSVGLLFVWGRSFLRPLEGERGWTAWLPVVSSLLVLVVGLFMLGGVLIHGGFLH